MFQLRHYLFRKLFAELNAPLIEAEYIPYDTLCKYLVFVHGNKASQCSRCELFEENRVRWFVSFKGAIWPKPLDLFPVFTLLEKIGKDFFFPFADHEPFGLREKVREQDRMMLAYGVVADCRGKKVRRYQLCALMDKLVERMLSICAGLAPDDRPCLI